MFCDCCICYTVKLGILLGEGRECSMPVGIFFWSLKKEIRDVLLYSCLEKKLSKNALEAAGGREDWTFLCWITRGVN